MDFRNQSLCDLGKQLNQTYLSTIIIGKFVSCGFNFLIGLTVFVCKGNTLTSNMNVKVIFWVHMILALLSEIASFLAIAFEQYRFTTMHLNDCDFLVSEEAGFTVRIPGFVIIVLQSSTFIALCFERLIATLLPNNYEKYPGCAVGVASVVISTVCYGGQSFGFIALPFNFNGKVLISSIMAGFNATRVHIIMVFIIVSDAVAVVFFAILAKINIRRFKNFRIPGTVNSKPLSYRFQIRENVSLIYELLPLMIFHLIVVTVCFTLQIVIQRGWLFEDLLDRLLFTEYANQEFQYTFLLSAYFILRGCCGIRGKGTVSTAKTNEEMHFHQLEEMWATYPEEGPSSRYSRPDSTECVSLDEVQIEPTVITVSAQVHNQEIKNIKSSDKKEQESLDAEKGNQEISNANNQVESKTKTVEIAKENKPTKKDKKSETRIQQNGKKIEQEIFKTNSVKTTKMSKKKTLMTKNVKTVLFNNKESTENGQKTAKKTNQKILKKDNQETVILGCHTSDLREEKDELPETKFQRIIHVVPRKDVAKEKQTFSKRKNVYAKKEETISL